MTNQTKARKTKINQGVRESTDTVEYCLTDDIQHEQDLVITTFPIVTLDQPQDTLDRKDKEKEGPQDPVHIEQEDSEDLVERRPENEEIVNELLKL